MADYLLWGKDPSGKNGKQNGLDLQTKHKTWDESPVDSLEQIMELPSFDESALSTLGSTQFRTKRQVFSREEALASSSPTVRQSFLVIFDAIDRLELMIALYELKHGKRTKEVRSELLARFDEEEVRTMRERITHWNQYTYLRKRHQLVEMRREQYTLRDSYRQTMFVQNDVHVEPVIADFDAGVEVLPLGMKHDGYTSSLVFRTWRELVPANVSAPDDQKLVSDLYWKKKQFAPGT